MNTPLSMYATMSVVVPATTWVPTSDQRRRRPHPRSDGKVNSVWGMKKPSPRLLGRGPLHSECVLVVVISWY